nr:hypothetical protein [uncultured Desulfobulbus sp.]
MKKNVFFNLNGLIFSIPMITILWLTFVEPDLFKNEFNNYILTFWLIMIIATLPWSIAIFIAGFFAVFSKEWWGEPVFYICIVSSIVFSHINGSVLFYRNNKTKKIDATNNEI